LKRDECLWWILSGLAMLAGGILIPHLLG